MISPLKNWKTFSTGVTSITTGGVGIFFAFKSGKPELIQAALIGGIPAILAGLGLIFARDNNTTSVDMGLQGVTTNSKGEAVITPDGPQSEQKTQEHIDCLIKETKEAKQNGG